MIIYISTMVLFALGVYCLIAKRHIIKKIIGMTIVEYAANLFIIELGYKKAATAPIMIKNDPRLSDAALFAHSAVDPLPQALVLTSIVIGLGTLALMSAYAIKLYEKYKTFDMSEINRLKG